MIARFVVATVLFAIKGSPITALVQSPIISVASINSPTLRGHPFRSTQHHRQLQRMSDKGHSNISNDDDHHAAAASAAGNASSRAIDFLTLTRSLKTTKRTGWVLRGVHNPESIADHMYRMSLMSMIASFSNGALDTNKCIKLALIHDLAEAKVGDITPFCGVSDQEKHDLELNTMQHISKMLGPMMGGDEILSLWNEYEEGATEEAKLLKDLDKIEMILQAQEYELEGSHEKSLDQFFSSTEGKFKTEIGQLWAKEIVSRRKKDAKNSEVKEGDSS